MNFSSQEEEGSEDEDLPRVKRARLAYGPPPAQSLPRHDRSTAEAKSPSETHTSQTSFARAFAPTDQDFDTAKEHSTLHKQPPRPPQPPEQPFSLGDSLLDHIDLLMLIAIEYLDPDEVFGLYAMNKRFHHLINTHVKMYVTGAARRWASLKPSRRVRFLDVEGGQIFPPGLQPTPVEYMGRNSSDLVDVLSWKNPLYKSYCVLDADLRWNNEDDIEPLSTFSTLPSPKAFGVSSEYGGVAAVPVPPLGPPSVGVYQSGLRPPLPSNDNNDLSQIFRTHKGKLVPSFKYLRLLCSRATAIHRILFMLAAENGLRIPTRAGPIVFAKLSILADISNTAGRQRYVQSQFSDHELFVAVMLMLKLDMAFSDPINAQGRGECLLRTLILAQNGGNEMLRMMDHVIRGKFPHRNSRVGLLQHWIKWRYNPDDAWLRSAGTAADAHAQQPTTSSAASHRLFGVASAEWGMLSREGWRPSWSDAAKLMTIPDIVISESLRRGLGLEGYLYDMIVWGFVDYRTSLDVAAPTLEDAEDVGFVLPEGWTVPEAMMRRWIRSVKREQVGYDPADEDEEASRAVEAWAAETAAKESQSGLTKAEQDELADLMRQFDVGPG